MKRTLILILGIALLILIKIFFLTKKEDPSKSGPPGKGQPTPVSVYIVDSSRIDNQITSVGTLRSEEEVDLQPEVSGKITSIHFREGDRVSKGQLLLQLNNADLLAQLGKLNVQRKVQEEKAGRLKSLLQMQGSSQEEYDQAQNVVASTDADIKYIQAQLAKTEVRAPFSGVIGLRSVSEGAFVTANTRIARLQQTDQLKLDFNVPERYISLLELPLKVAFGVQGRSDKFEANVYAIEPSVSNTTRTVQLRARVSNNAQQLLPGQFAQVLLPIKNDHSSILIPTQAIIPILKGQKVFVCKQGKAAEVKVETGYRNDAMIEVLSGLSVGDSVITTGIMSLKADAPLKIIPAKAQKKEVRS